MQYLVTCCLSTSTQLEAIAIGVLRDCARDKIYSTMFNANACNQRIIAEIQDNLHHIENEINQLKEATTTLELALWKMRINEESHNEKATRRQKKIKIDESITRSQCRATCGADIVIAIVLLFHGIWGISVRNTLD